MMQESNGNAPKRMEGAISAGLFRMGQMAAPLAVVLPFMNGLSVPWWAWIVMAAPTLALMLCSYLYPYHLWREAIVYKAKGFRRTLKAATRQTHIALAFLLITGVAGAVYMGTPAVIVELRAPDIQVTFERSDATKSLDAFASVSIGFDSGVEIPSESFRGELWVTNVALEKCIKIPINFTRAHSDRGEVSNVFQASALIDLIRNYNQFRTARYRLDLRAMVEGLDPPMRDEGWLFDFPYEESFEDPITALARANTDIWTTQDGSLIGDVRGSSGNWSVAHLEPAFMSHMNFEISGAAVIGLESDRKESDGGTPNLGLALVVGHLFTIIVCDGFRNCFSIKMPGEDSAPSNPSATQNSVSLRTDTTLKYGATFQYRVRKETTADGTAISLWIDNKLVRRRTVNLSQKRASWSPSFRVLGGLIEVHFLRVNYI